MRKPKKVMSGTPSDVVETNPEVIKQCFDLLSPLIIKSEYEKWPVTGDYIWSYLDPCAGLGQGFYGEAISRHKPDSNSLFNGCEWAEIREGVDFFDIKRYSDRHLFDWIISNPPYSIYDEFLLHSLKVADNVAYLIPLTKVFKNMRLEKAIADFGGLHSVWNFGSGTNIGFQFGFLVGLVYYRRNYKGKINYRIVR